MAEEKKPGADRQGSDRPTKAEQDQGQDGKGLSTQAERDRQNRDDPSRAPESGDQE